MADMDTIYARKPEAVKAILAGDTSVLHVMKALRLETRLARLAALPPEDDQARLHALGLTIYPYDVWAFDKCDGAFGLDKYPGRIPGQLVAHVLYFFTQPGEVVLDPMAGSGTTIDVCQALGRTCYAYDVQPHPARSDILQHDLTTGWPDQLPAADLIFWDPPYFSKKDSGYSDASISRLSRQAYLRFFATRFQEACALVKPGTRLAFLMSDWTPPEDPEPDETTGVFLWDYLPLLTSAGWTLTRMIDCPLPTQLVLPDFVEKFRKARRLARLNRWLLIAEKH